ncbi:hypothetical protein ABT382_24795 [Streptomyces pharetrae]|uniref:hypothetical protein n=1 Tax=Streptomyces pharetrae TaxID=291370 RepID=UPI00335D34F8
MTTAPSDWLSTAEVAAALKVSQRAVQRWGTTDPTTARAAPFTSCRRPVRPATAWCWGPVLAPG